MGKVRNRINSIFIAVTRVFASLADGFEQEVLETKCSLRNASSVSCPFQKLPPSYVFSNKNKCFS
jgi:hypothetical protein